MYSLIILPSYSNLPPYETYSDKMKGTKTKTNLTIFTQPVLLVPEA